MTNGRNSFANIGRNAVFDEIEARRKDETQKYAHIEQLYLQLKQNCEDRRDYERASDFHYGEKEMRRINKKGTPLGVRFLLSLYLGASGYGEKWLWPLFWTAVLLFITTFAYLKWGLLRLKDTETPVDWTRIGEALLYGSNVMLLLKPTDFVPYEIWGNLVHTLQSVIGPILFGLFALAVRQKLKR